MPGGRKQKAGNRHGLAGFLFTLPFMVLFLGMFIAPLVYALYLSLYREQLVGGNEFVGLEQLHGRPQGQGSSPPASGAWRCSWSSRCR